VILFLVWSIVVPWTIMSRCTLGHEPSFNILQYNQDKNLFCSRSIPGSQSEKIDPAAVGHVIKDVINSNLKVRIQQYNFGISKFTQTRLNFKFKEPVLNLSTEQEMMLRKL